MPNIDISNNNKEQEGTSNNNKDNDKLQQEVGYTAEALARSIKDDTLGQVNYNLSLEISQNKSRSQGSNYCDSKLGSDRTILGRDDRRSPIVKRKRQSSYNGSLTQRKRYYQSQQKHTRQLSIHTNSSRRSPKLQSTLDQISTVTRSPSAKDKLSTPRQHIADPELLCNYIDLSRSSSDIPPTVINITFRPQYLPYSSYKAVIHNTRERRSIPLSQLTQVVESFGTIGTISNLDVHQLKHHFLLVSGVCQPTSSQSRLVGRIY